MPTPPTAQLAGQRERSAVDLAVDLGFGVLLIVCGARYFAFHDLAGTGTIALILALITGASYAIASVGRAAGTTRQRFGLCVSILAWLPLVIIAPSFGWCAFALFFAVHRVLSGARALALSAALVVAASMGLDLMSGGQDLGLVLGPFFGGLVLSYAYWSLDRSHSEQRRLNTELREARERLALSEREAGAAAERARLAGELHDTVAQRTAESLLLLEAHESGSPSDARASLRRALTETREFMLGLVDPRAERPTSRHDALASLASDAGASFEVTGHERPLSDEISHALQRAAQESLRNARKHARAERIRVTLSYFPESIAVDVVDDGVGFAAPADPAMALSDDPLAGFGLRAMTWRIRSLAGELRIESVPGEGTAVSAVIPTHSVGATQKLPA